MNYWYSARPNEIFLDLDSIRAANRALSVLSLTLKQENLGVEFVYKYPTRTKDHCHVIILLDSDMDLLSRAAWSLWMGTDRLRVAYVLKRESRGVRNTELLVSKNEYHRKPDAICQCRRKHKPDSVTLKCPAMRKLLGKDRAADYFTRTGRHPLQKTVWIGWGKLDLDQIKNWKDNREG